MPNGLFERVLCLLVSESGYSEGSLEPTIQIDKASITFKGAQLFVIAEKDAKRVRIIVDEREKPPITDVLAFLGHILETLEKDVFGCRLKGSVLLKARGVEGVTEESMLRAAMTKGAGVVQLFASASGKRTVDTECFSHFRTLVSIVSRNENRHKKVYDCFLAHEWGTQVSGFVTHREVLSVSKMLIERGFSVWIDERNLKHDIAKGIVEGLESSKKVIVFVTERYLKRSGDMNTNCARELNSAMKKGQENVEVVVLEEGVLDTNSWKGTVFEYYLGHKKYVDFSSEQKKKDNIEELCELIQE